MNDLDEHAQWLNDFNEQLKLYHQLYGDTLPMNINEEFPSNFLRAADLQGKKIKVVIDRVERAEFQDGSKKPAVYFQDKQKGLALNKTNAMVISDAYSPETDNWIGKELVLYSQKVPFQNQMVDALRVEIPVAVAEDDDSIPF